MADLAGYFPSSPWYNAVEFKTNTPQLATETNSGKTIRRAYGHQYYSWKVKYPPITRSELGNINGFLAQTFGSLFSFEIVLPEISYSKSENPPTTTVRTNGSAARGDKTVSLTNCGANKTVLKAGDFFRFTSHSKVYQATNTCQSDGSGNAILYFAGSLVSDVPTSTDLVLTGVAFTAIIENDAHQVNVGLGGMAQLTLEMRETW